MKKHWENIYLALSRYRDKFNPKKEDINNKYNLLINELRVQEENELKAIADAKEKEKKDKLFLTAGIDIFDVDVYKDSK